MSSGLRKDHYVYKHAYGADTFYIGIGCSRNYDRAYSKSNRNKFWLSYTSKHGEYGVSILHDKITKQEACKIEIELIKHYGKRCDNTGVLVNISDGGENSLFGIPRTQEHSEKISFANMGRKVSDETKLKQRNAKLGAKHSVQHCLNQSIAGKGKKRTDETRKRISEGHKGLNTGTQSDLHKNYRWGILKEKYPNGIASKSILCLNNNTIYPSAAKAALDLGICDKHIGSVCKGKRIQHLGYKFKYAI